MDLYGARYVSAEELRDYCCRLNVNLPQQLDGTLFVDELEQVEPVHSGEAELRYGYWQVHQVFGMITSIDSYQWDELASWIDTCRNSFDEIMDVTQIQMAETDCYKLLSNLLDLHERYRAIERYRLADIVKRDISYLEILIRIKTGVERHEIAEKIGELNEYNKKTFRHFDVREKERDEAVLVLNGYSISAGRY